MKVSTLTFLVLLFSILGKAQVRPYKISFVESLSDEGFPSIKGEIDSLNFLKLTESEKEKLVNSGYLLANIDSLYCLSDSCRATIYVGEQFKWAQVQTKGFPPGMLDKVGFRQKEFTNKEVNLTKYENLINRILSVSANTGYPFAEVSLDSSSMIGDTFSGIITYTAGQQVKYDSLSLSSTFIKPKFLSAYLNIKEGDVFNMNQINSIGKRISRLNYCQLNETPAITFSNGLASTSLNLTPVKANKLDAIIGLIPNQGNKQLMVTGFVDLDLQNLFKSGKRLTFLWRQFNQKSQVLRIGYQHPNLFKSPVGLGLSFDLLKQDTTFLTRNFRIKAGFETRTTEVALVLDFEASRVLGIINVEPGQLELSDFNLQYYGLDFRQMRLDDPVNPLAGYDWFLGINVGSKQIVPNASIPSEAYDSIKANTVQMKVDLGGSYNHSLGSVFVAHLDLTAGTIWNQNPMFLNDLYRIGGINSLRGFNDLDLFASSYLVARIEARLLIGHKSRIFLFYDQGFLNNIVIKEQDSPFGFGAGLLLGVGSGSLQLAYALGKSSQQSLSLNQAKIHLGYVAKF